MPRKKRLANGFGAAFDGFKETILYEKSFKVMLAIATVVVAAMFYFPTGPLEKVVLLAAIFAVLVLELINSVVERVTDFLKPGHSEEARLVKDLMAAIVFLASVGAVIIGLMIFVPYIISWWK
ncbi:MAG: diacylglycerol kinase family protein [bacterium]|nr:diacylglycerol kinase family protein [bacterium]